jgi:hypothetical protein
MAEYFDQVNPLIIHRSAALDIDPFDRSVADANDERSFSSRRAVSAKDRLIGVRRPRTGSDASQGLVPINVPLAETAPGAMRTRDQYWRVIARGVMIRASWILKSFTN